MDNLKDGMILYHGSWCEVKRPELKYCAAYKDFGKGFYLTTSKAQAVSFSKLSTSKAISSLTVPSSQTYGVVSTFKVRSVREISQYIFPEADTGWLHCVVAHRNGKVFPELINSLKKYDVIAGKIANDKTNATIATYMLGAFGEIGSESADSICISLLLPERLSDQYCFRSDKALECLEFTESEKICLR